MINKFIVVFFALSMSFATSAERKLLALDKIKEFYNIGKTGLFYTPEIKRKDCNIIGMLFENSLKSSTEQDISQILKDYQTDDERAFWWGNHAISSLIKNYNISSKRDICFVIMAKKENVFYLFKIPTNVLKKLSLRDFGSKDNQIIAKALDLNENRVPSNLPYPLSKAFSHIKMSKQAFNESVVQTVMGIQFNNQLTRKYIKFLNDYSFDYLGFDESKLDTAYDNLALQSMQDEMIAEERRKTKKQTSAARKNNRSFTFSADCYGYCTVRKITLSSAGASGYIPNKSSTANSIWVGEGSSGSGVAGAYQYNVELEVGSGKVLGMGKDTRKRKLCGGRFSTDGYRKWIKVTLRFDSCRADIYQN